jgi:ERCC4-type nuclease
VLFLKDTSLSQSYHCDSFLSRPRYLGHYLIIEGGDPFFTTRRVNVQAIRGMLNAITVSLRVPILYSLTAVETAQHLLLVALKEQNKDGRTISVHGKRSHMDLDEQREYIVSAITNIGPLASRNLLSYFGNVENVMKASPEELANVKLIGTITAEHIRKVVSEKYGEGGNNGREKFRENVSVQQGAEELASQLWV